jgi:hypothetical protein
MGYPLTGYLYREFQVLDMKEVQADHELYLVRQDGTYRVVEDAARFLMEADPDLDPDDGVWIVDRRERLFAFRIQTDGHDVVASVRSALVDIREVFGADLTDGLERLVRYFQLLLRPAEAMAGGGKHPASPYEAASLITEDLDKNPPRLPGMSIIVQGIEPLSQWALTGSGELVEVP